MAAPSRSVNPIRTRLPDRTINAAPTYPGHRPNDPQARPTAPVKSVCHSCDHEWIGGMEVAAKPLLTAMFNARGTSVVLDENAQLVLARWAFKTAAVAAQIDWSDPFPFAQRRGFHQTNHPPRHPQIRIGTASGATAGQLVGLRTFLPNNQA
jgi:hypothetical protein